MRIEWLPTVLRRFSHVSSIWSTSRRRKPAVTRISRSLESLEDRSLLAANLLGINLPPLGVVDNYNVLGNTSINAAVSVLANDTDPNTGDILHAVLAVDALHGTVDLGADGFFTYTPDLGFIGTDVFSYIPSDGLLGGLGVPTLVTLNVGNIVGAASPVAVNDNFAVAKDSVLNISLGTFLDGVLANDSDPDTLQALLTANLVTSTQHGSLTFLPTGTFIYTPNAGFTGTDTFTYQASDLNSLSNVATATITVVPVGPGGNNTPVANNDSYSVNQDSLLNIALPGVLSNDTDADGNVLLASVVTGPTHGTLIFLPTGAFTYTPNPGYSGPDSFTYQATDLLSNSNTATVSITVNPTAGGPVGNTPPVANNDSFNATEDTLLNISVGGVLANDTDANGNLLTAVLVTPPQHGTLVLLPTGMFNYTPDPNYSGPDSFTYQASDLLSLSNVATVSISVAGTNDAPVSANDSYTTATDTVLNVPVGTGVLANDSDADGNPLTATLVGNASSGNVVLNPNGSFTYTPNAGFNGTDTFTYRANDGTTNGNLATVTISVGAAANGSPTATNDNYNLNEDQMLTTVAANGLLFNDTDPENDTLTAVLVSNPSHGTVLLNPNGTFTYTPNENYNGTDSFTYQANDGTSNSNVATVTFTIAAVNDAANGGSDAYDVDEGETLTVAAPGVLSNDVDPEGSGLTANLVSNVQHGTLNLNSNGSFTYTPTAGFNGTDSFTYSANDGSTNSTPITVTLNVNSVNSAPVAVNNNYTVNEDATLTVPAVGGLLTNDSDADGDTLTAGIVTLPQHGTLTLNSDGSFSYTPNANFNGTDSFEYRATDGSSNSNIATVQITVTPVNDAPVGANDIYSTTTGATLTVAANGVLTNDTDVDGDTLTATAVTNPTHGTLSLSSNGGFTYTPTAGFTGTDTFTYQVNDGTTSTGPVTVTIQVNAPVNTAPVSTNDSYSVGENVTLNVPVGTGVLSNDTDAEGDTLTAAVVTTTANGTLTLNANGSFTYVPNANFDGTDTFTYRANDGTENGNLATVTIQVTAAVNTPPVSVNDTYNVNEDNVLTIPAGLGVLANDTDVNGNTLTATLVSQPAHGDVTLNADGSFTYTPDADFNGTDSFTYRANDGTADGNLATVTLTVAPQGEAPVVTTTVGVRSTRGHRKLVLDPGVTVTDADSPNLGGGSIRVAIQNGNGSTPGRRDSLEFSRRRRDSVNGRRGDLKVGNVSIGTYTGGKKGAPLTIQLNSNATIGLVQTALQNLLFRGTGGRRGLGTRIVTIQVTDNTQLSSNIATKTVNVGTTPPV